MVELDERYAHRAYAEIKGRNWKYAASFFAIVLGTALSALSLISLFAVLSTNQRNGASFFEQDINLLTPGGTLLILSVPLLIAFAGIRARAKLNSEKFNPLRTNGQELFVEAEMSKKWQVFLDWMKNSKADIGVEQKDEVIIILTPELVEFDLTQVFILGEARHRNQLIGDVSVNMSPLVMRERDWRNFEKHWTEYHDRNNKISPSKGELAETEVLSELHETTQHSRHCPRFRYMLDNKEELFPRYVNLRIKKSELTKKRWPCHKLLIFLAENLSLLDIYFDSHKSRITNEAKLKSFSASIGAILEVDGYKNATRLSDLDKREWRLLEKHIKSVGLISEMELEQVAN